jgi:hypothetical protein
MDLGGGSSISLIGSVGNASGNPCGFAFGTCR